jgi:hypothetical protein
VEAGDSPAQPSPRTPPCDGIPRPHPSRDLAAPRPGRARLQFLSRPEQASAPKGAASSFDFGWRSAFSAAIVPPPSRGLQPLRYVLDFYQATTSLFMPQTFVIPNRAESPGGICCQPKQALLVEGRAPHPSRHFAKDGIPRPHPSRDLGAPRPGRARLQSCSKSPARTAPRSMLRLGGLYSLIPELLQRS